MGFAQPACERVGLLRNRHQVDMVGHQAVTEHCHTMQFTLPAESFEIESPVFVLQEDILAIGAPLCDMVRYADRNHAGHARIGLSV